MTFRTSSLVVALTASLSLSHVITAQQPKSLTLEDILKRLDDNLNRYDKLVPSFFCEEHAISEMESRTHKQTTDTDSIFRLKRTEEPDHTTSLVESRDIQTMNGKPASTQDIDGPALISGVFEGGLAIVSLSQTVCIHYSLQRPNKNQPTEPYIIRFATVLNPENSGDCLLQENSKGRAFVDPISMQITHLELTTQHHTIIPGDRYTDPIIGKRVLTIDYSPVVLNGGTYWMPNSITSRSMSEAGTFHESIWSFRATYRNYHKLQVSSRILPAGEAPKR